MLIVEISEFKVRLIPEIINIFFQILFVYTTFASYETNLRSWAYHIPSSNSLPILQQASINLFKPHQYVISMCVMWARPRPRQMAFKDLPRGRSKRNWRRHDVKIVAMHCSPVEITEFITNLTYFNNNKPQYQFEQLTQWYRVICSRTTRLNGKGRACKKREEKKLISSCKFSIVS